MGDKKIIKIHNMIFKVKDIIDCLDASAKAGCTWLDKDQRLKRTHIYDAIIRQRCDPDIKAIADTAITRRAGSRDHYKYTPNEVYTLFTKTTFAPAGWIKDDNVEFVMEKPELASDTVDLTKNIELNVNMDLTDKKYVGSRSSVVTDIQNFASLTEVYESLKKQLQDIEADLSTYPEYFVNYVKGLD